FGDEPGVHVNNTKSFIGHAMGAAGALELAGNLPRGLVANEPKRHDRVETIMNMSFGMLGINSAVIVRKFTGA
ncbi:MAG: beta-ketoacyl-[acyl-carrier-protein] synthase family protein, partial [Planctomycetota bacterium]